MNVTLIKNGSMAISQDISCLLKKAVKRLVNSTRINQRPKNIKRI